MEAVVAQAAAYAEAGQWAQAQLILQVAQIVLLAT